MMTFKLRKNINKFFEEYDPERICTKVMTRSDMDDHNALMTAYEFLWMMMEYYDYDPDSAEYQWMAALYAQLGDYITTRLQNPDDGKGTAVTIVKCVASVFGSFCVGMFSMAAIAYGINLTFGIGLVLGAVLAVYAGVGAYEDVKAGDR